MTGLLLTVFLVLLALGAPRHASGLLSLRSATRTLFGARIVGPTLVVAAGLALLARRYLDVTDYAERTVVSTIGFLALYMLAEGLALHTARLVEWLDRRSFVQVAGTGMLASLLAGWLVFDGFPHVSDEVAYLFQAKTMALGRLSLPPPEPRESFVFLHTLVDNGQWYGIMNPGWPAFLALGFLMHAPWLVNPLLGALALWCFRGFFQEAGVTGRTARLAILLLACSPFLVFMNGTYMSHAATLVLFGLFCWRWARLLRLEQRRDAVVAGLALGACFLVRPVDTVAIGLPFAVQGLLRLRRTPRLLPLFGLALGAASLGVLATLAYNRQLTGHATMMTVSRYFEVRNPHEQFGLGFGPEMGTKLHGEEWPGFYPADAVVVTAYRLSQLCLDLYGLPLLPIAAMVLAVRRRRDWDEWLGVSVAAAASLTGVYFLHFYHGVAYGSRHLYLATPAIALLMARPAADWLERGTEETTRRGRAIVAALVCFTVLFAYPPLVREYGRLYRGVDGRIRDAVRVAGVTDALVFVDEHRWGWKFAFPLNAYPLERNRVLFVRDDPALNAQVRQRYPRSQYLSLRIERDGQVSLAPLPAP